MKALIKSVLITALALALWVGGVPSTAAPEGTVVETYRNNLKFPVDMAHAPGTRTVFFTEKNTGKIRELKGGHLRAGSCFNLKVDTEGEQGALGIVLDPDYDQNHFLYVYFSSQLTGDNLVARFEVVDHVCQNRLILISGIPSNYNHNGGQLEFVGDHLFVSTGDAREDPLTVQDTDTLAGKILRINSDGSIPADNPFSEPGDPNPVWSFGHRNPFGLAARGDTTQLLESENGPGCDDELNLIEAGVNYGWGNNYPTNCQGPKIGPSPREPLRKWGAPTIAPTDMVFYEGRLDALDGTLLMGDYKFGRIHRFELSEDGSELTDESIAHDDDANIIDVAKGPGGWVYYLTETAIKRIKEVP